MTDLMACEKTVRIIEVDGDANSDAMAAAVQHIQQKKGADTGYRYVVKGPNYSCAVEHNGANWAIVDYSDSDKAEKSLATVVEVVDELPPSEVPSEPVEILYNEPGR